MIETKKEVQVYKKRGSKKEGQVYDRNMPPLVHASIIYLYFRIL